MKELKKVDVVVVHEILQENIAIAVGAIGEYLQQEGYPINYDIFIPNIKKMLDIVMDDMHKKIIALHLENVRKALKISTPGKSDER